MKSFIWRLRRSAPWFLATLAIFSIAYFTLVLISINSGIYNGIGTPFINCFSAMDPIIPATIIGFVFYMITVKRFSYDEELFYGHSRKYAYLASQGVGVVYSFIFAVYAVGLALLMRRGIVIMYDVLIPSAIYYLSASEVICNLALIFVVQMITFELASTLRKFKSWKFWLTFICYTVTIVLLVWKIVFDDTGKLDLNYWQAFFAALAPQVLIMAIGDFFMTRGRQYR